MRMLAATILALLAIAAPARAAGPPVMTQTRTLAPGIVELSATIPTGPGRYDRIGLHRVTALGSRGEPGVLLAHGDAWGFDPAFIPTPDPADSLPVYLARRGIDVWGIDFGWTLVPRAETDFSFMKDWGLQHDVDDLERALGAARAVRALTGDGAGPLALLGWSRGGWTSYALLDQEAARPAALRQVDAFVSVDNEYKTADPDDRALWCSVEQSDDNALAQGDYAGDNTFFADLGSLALSDPGAPSPLFGPPYTNLQASLTYGAAAFQFGSFTPWYHFVGGFFPGGDTTAIPTGLRYTSPARWNNLLAAASSYEPERLFRDTEAVTCDDGSTPQFDSRLGSVRVPVLHVGAAGGFGTHGLHTLALLGSRDVTSLIVRRRPVGDETTDYGHADLFQASDADQLVWAPITAWLLRHR